MAELPDDLRQALEADDAEDLGRVLRRRRPADLAALMRLLTPDPAVPVPPNLRTKALYALGAWGDPAAVPRITQLLPDLDERGRMSALSALDRLGTPEADAAILAHVNDSSPQVRKIVVSALKKRETRQARRALQAVASGDPVEWVRETAVRSNEKD
jgi:HEAT repeat protein